MALGLNGHLAKLGKLESFDYLMKGSEPISIGLLLGMAASRRGSMDVLVTKKLSTQVCTLVTMVTLTCPPAGGPPAPHRHGAPPLPEHPGLLPVFSSYSSPVVPPHC